MSRYPLACDKCAKQFESDKSLARHKKIMGGFTFKQCASTYPIQDRLYTHFLGTYGKGYDARHKDNCDDCDKRGTNHNKVTISWSKYL